MPSLPLTRSSMTSRELNGIFTTEWLAEEAGVDLWQAQNFCSELIQVKVLYKNVMLAENEFLIKEEQFKKWKARRGIG